MEALWEKLKHVDITRALDKIGQNSRIFSFEGYAGEVSCKPSGTLTKYASGTLVHLQS